MTDEDFEHEDFACLAVIAAVLLVLLCVATHFLGTFLAAGRALFEPVSMVLRVGLVFFLASVLEVALDLALCAYALPPSDGAPPVPPTPKP